MDIIMKVKFRLEHKINVTLWALLPNKMTGDSRGLVASSDNTEQDKLPSRNKRAIPLLAIAEGTAAIGSMLIKGINALVDAKRLNSFNNTIKMLNANVEITHNRLVTLENRTSMMVKAIMPVLKDLKLQINKTNEQLASQYRMMSSPHNRYNLLLDRCMKCRRYIILHYYCLRTIFKQMIIDWTNTEVTGISGIRIEMPNEANISIFTDNDLTHITDDHFEINLVA